MTMRTFSALLCVMLALGPASMGCELLGLSEPNTKPPEKKKTTSKSATKKAPAPSDAKATASTKTEDDKNYKRPEYPENRRRNPFSPSAAVIEPLIPDQPDDKDGPTAPAEKFPVNSFELIAIVSEIAVPRAMFIDPDGFGHILKEGDKIGIQRAVITDIRDNEVDLREGGTDDEFEGGESRVRTVKLRNVDLGDDDPESISDEERDAIEKLLNSQAGRDALAKALRDNAEGARAVEGAEPPSNTPLPNSGSGGIAPPSLRR